MSDVVLFVGFVEDFLIRVDFLLFLFFELLVNIICLFRFLVPLKEILGMLFSLLGITEVFQDVHFFKILFVVICLALGVFWV